MVFRRAGRLALGPARELNIGCHAEALNLPTLSLSSRSSHHSDLEIFECKQYGPGAACPYLNKSLGTRAGWVLEESRRQFFAENAKHTHSAENNQTVLLS